MALTRAEIGTFSFVVGFPIIVAAAVTSGNSGVLPGMFSTIVGGFVFAAFLVLYAFEIKRLADSDGDAGEGQHAAKPAHSAIVTVMEPKAEDLAPRKVMVSDAPEAQAA